MKSRTFIVGILVGIWLPGPIQGQGNGPSPRFSQEKPEAVRKRLPRGEIDVPAWARILSGPLPRATGAMLELDYVHRVRNPLGPILAGKLRWAAAKALGSDYGCRYAEADLLWAGMRAATLKRITGDPRNRSEEDRQVMGFARRLTLAAHEIEDAEVADLIKRHGPEAVVAMVHTVACANFQNRIFLALGVKVETDGPFPPRDPCIDPKQQEKLSVPQRPSLEQALQSTLPGLPLLKPKWKKIDAGGLEKALFAQQKRPGRIQLPGENLLGELSPKERARAGQVIWTQVSMGYQPLLTRTWFACMGKFREESKLDRVFANTVFWVVTRSNECFY